MFEDSKNHYETLGISSQANTQEIRNAYLKLKNSVSKGNIATYSLLSESEIDKLNWEVETAYQTLIHPQKRADYDRSLGMHLAPHPETSPFSADSPAQSPFASPPSFFSTSEAHPLAGVEKPQPFVPSIARDWSQETLWTGALLREVRESRGITIEALAEMTKVSRAYLRAIEAEEFQKLPAPVFVRGFVTSICRVLKIPAEKVTPKIIDRLTSAPEPKK